MPDCSTFCVLDGDIAPLFSDLGMNRVNFFVSLACSNCETPINHGPSLVPGRAQPMKSILIVLAAFSLLVGCATSLTEDGQKVRLVTAGQKEQCETIKLITFHQRLGPNKPGNAMKGALNEAAAAGGNGFYVVSTSSDWAEGASVIGEALRCKS